MARKKKEVVQEVKEIKENIITTPLEEIMGDRFGRYSKYIIQDRALPDARDGLKPVQRRILYAMHESGYTHLKQHRKSARVVGEVMGKYHPHGDSSIYEAIVRMSQDWKLRETLIDMHGNNGSMDDDPAAASRYTEVRLAPIAQCILNDIDKDTVEFAPNFDDTEIEPTVLPTRYPNLLVNGITGIAAGYATNIPPHNLGEVLDATVYRLQHPKCTLDELMEFVQGPDFPTGGIVQGRAGIRDAFTSGKGKIMVRSKCEVVQTKTIQQIIVHEIPYEVVKSNLVKRIDEIRVNKALEGILDVRDESDRNGLRICIDLKKDANSELILNYLYKNTDLQVSYNYNVVAIVNKRPMLLGLAQMLDAFIEHRKDVVTRRCKFELKKAEARCHILEGLIKAISVLDEVIKIIRSSSGKADSKEKLIKKFKFSEAQAEAIVTLQLYRLSNTDVVQLQNELDALNKQIQELNKILNSSTELKKVIIKECKQVKADFGTPRLSKIEEHVQEIVIDKLAMVSNEQVMLTVSKDGYVKKVSMRSYGSSTDLPGIKEGDQFVAIKEVNTLNTILFITDKGNYGYVPVFELNEHKWKDVGSHLNNNLTMNANEKIKYVFILDKFDEKLGLMTLSKTGMIKHTNLKELEVSRNNKMMSLMKVADKDEIVGACLVKEKDEVVVVASDGYTVRYGVENISPTGCRGKGIIAIKNTNCAGLTTTNYPYLLCVTEKGAMKRIKMDDISKTNRAVKGELIAKTVKTKPNVIQYVIGVNGNDELNLIEDGVSKKCFAKDVTIMGKEATFSNTIKLNKDYYLY